LAVSVPIKTCVDVLYIRLNNLTPNFATMTRASVALNLTEHNPSGMHHEQVACELFIVWTVCFLSKPKHSAEIASIQLCTSGTGLYVLDRTHAG